MAVSYQLVIDCTSPEPLAHFWAEASHCRIAVPPQGFASWDGFYRSIGVPEDELGIGADRIEDPKDDGPDIWFQVVPEKKSTKNRIHLDVNASGGRGPSLDVRRDRVEAEAARLVALGATRLGTLAEEGLAHYAVALTIPKATSSSSTDVGWRMSEDGVVKAHEGLSAAEVLEVLDAVRSVGCRFWLEGGWELTPSSGGRRDLTATSTSTTTRTTRTRSGGPERPGLLRGDRLAAEQGRALGTGSRWVDLHPLVIDHSGDARQAGLDGGWHEFHSSWFTTGTVGGTTVPCVSVEAQRFFHAGYELRTTDQLDLAELAGLAE